MLKVVLRSSLRDMVERKASRSSMTNLLYQKPPLMREVDVLAVSFVASASALARREAKPTLVFHRVMQIPTHMVLLRAKMRRDLDTCDMTTMPQTVCRGRSVSGRRKVRACAMRSSGKSCRLAHVMMGSGSGGMVMCFARLDLGADTASDSRRRGKNSTLVGDDMVVGMVVSAAALMGVVP